MQPDFKRARIDPPKQKPELAVVEKKLADAKQELTIAKQELTIVEKKLTIVEKKLTHAKQEFADAKQELTIVEKKLTHVKQEGEVAQQKLMAIHVRECETAQNVVTTAQRAVATAQSAVTSHQETVNFFNGKVLNLMRNSIWTTNVFFIRFNVFFREKKISLKVMEGFFIVCSGNDFLVLLSWNKCTLTKLIQQLYRILLK